MKRICLVIIIACIYINGYSQEIAKWKITDIENLMEKSDSILVINFWATFCVPCIEEIPDLIKFSNKYKKQKVKLYLVSLDFSENYPAKIKKFVAKKKYNASVAWLNETNADYFCPKIAETWSGAIPATLIVNKKSGYRKFYEEKLSAPEIENAIQKAIK
jgi:thiol-disulfide isomerase/thioredoxin